MPSNEAKKVQVIAPPVATAGNDASTVISEAPFAGVVTAAYYIADAAITGAATNNRTVTVTNRGGAGSGTTAVATLAFGSGINAAKDADTTLALNATAANLVVAQGDVLTFDSVHVGTGIADPGGLVVVEITLTPA